MENDPYFDDETQYERGPAPSTATLAPPGPNQYRTPEGVLINGAPPPPPIDNSRAQAIAELYSRVPVDQATKAIEAATRLEGMLGFDADRKAGVPVMEALAKWSPKMYFNHPGAIASLQKAAAAKAMPFVPTSTTVDGQKLIQMSPNRYAFPPSGEGSFMPKEVKTESGRTLMQVSPKSFRVMPDSGASLLQKENLRDINKAMDAARKTIGVESGSRKAAAQAELDALTVKKRDLLNSMALPAVPGAAAPSAVKRLVWKDGQLVPKE